MDSFGATTSMSNDRLISNDRFNLRVRVHVSIIPPRCSPPDVRDVARHCKDLSGDVTSYVSDYVKTYISDISDYATSNACNYATRNAPVQPNIATFEPAHMANGGPTNLAARIRTFGCVAAVVTNDVMISRLT